MTNLPILAEPVRLQNATIYELDLAPKHIPPLVHQTWKNNEVPKRWQDPVASVKRAHSSWQYKLWTDADIDAYVKEHHPDLYPTFAAYNKPIMRADAIRYVLMYDLGGLYCDMDYEFLRPFDYGNHEVVLSWEFSPDYGDDIAQVANYVFASRPGHPFWRDVIDEMIRGPNLAAEYDQVPGITGPEMLSRVYFNNSENYSGVYITERPVHSPFRIHGVKERKVLMNNGLTIGFHHGTGTWKDRLSAAYWRRKLKKIFKV